jgi:hypothetical protein
MQEMTPQERGELLAEAERRDLEGASELARGMLDPTEMGRDAQSAH